MPGYNLIFHFNIKWTSLFGAVFRFYEKKSQHSFHRSSTLNCLWNEIFDFDFFSDSDSFWGTGYGEHICFWLQQLEVHFISLKKRQKCIRKNAAKTACVTSLVRVCHSKDGILKQWESELDSSSDILQCLNAVSNYNDYWILCIC